RLHGVRSCTPPEALHGAFGVRQEPALFSDVIVRARRQQRTAEHGVVLATGTRNTATVFQVTLHTSLRLEALRRSFADGDRVRRAVRDVPDPDGGVQHEHTADRMITAEPPVVTFGTRVVGPGQVVIIAALL